MATYERETASAVEGDSRYGKLRLILLYRTLLQSSATTAPSGGSLHFIRSSVRKNLP